MQPGLAIGRASARQMARRESHPDDDGPRTLFSFEPDPETLFDALLPRYVATRVYAALLEAAASESAV